MLLRVGMIFLLMQAAFSKDLKNADDVLASVRVDDTSNEASGNVLNEDDVLAAKQVDQADSGGLFDRRADESTGTDEGKTVPNEAVEVIQDPNDNEKTRRDAGDDDYYNVQQGREDENGEQGSPLTRDELEEEMKARRRVEEIDTDGMITEIGKRIDSSEEDTASLMKAICAYKQFENLTGCLPTGTGKPNIDNATQDEILNQHNFLRANVHTFKDRTGKLLPRALDMIKLTWDNKIAYYAQKWADNCQDEHDKNEQRVIPGYFRQGQNLAMGGYKNWADAIQAWFDEYKLFEFGNDDFSMGAIGHFTQMVWSSTTLLGCGYAKCSFGNYYVCNYSPPGNMAGYIQRPYKKGNETEDMVCTPENRNGTLCDCPVKFCKNNGVLKPSTCTCTCYNKPWITGELCHLNCAKVHDNYCSKSWDSSFCKYSNVPLQYCPGMCKVCPSETAITTQATITGQATTTTYVDVETTSAREVTTIPASVDTTPASTGEAITVPDYSKTDPIFPMNDPIKTKGGNANGADCVEKFKYKGKVYEGCTTVNDVAPWCATTKDYENDGKWGYCIYNPVESELFTIDGRETGKKCIFPFLYQDRLFFTCTRFDHFAGKLWCATVPNYNRENLWGICPEPRCRDAKGKIRKVGASWTDGGFDYKCTKDGLEKTAQPEEIKDVTCRQGRGTTYRGTLSKTPSGLTCQAWNTNKPHRNYYQNKNKYPEKDLTKAKNYCRNPSSSIKPWCYTTSKYKRYEYCNIKLCTLDECTEADYPRCNQVYKGRIWHQWYCSNSWYQSKCKAMCLKCKATKCIDYQDKDRKIGDEWVLAGYTYRCTKHGIARIPPKCLDNKKEIRKTGDTWIYKGYKYECTKSGVKRTKILKLCTGVDYPSCNQNYYSYYYPKSRCKYSCVIAKCLAMCGRCKATRCQDEKRKSKKLGDKWTSAHIIYTCTEKGVKREQGCTVSKVKNLFLHAEETKEFNGYVCTCLKEVSTFNLKCRNLKTGKVASTEWRIAK